jgi:hypothetical protein
MHKEQKKCSVVNDDHSSKKPSSNSTTEKKRYICGAPKFTKDLLTLSTVVDILTFVSLHHGDRVAAVLLVESASSGAAVSAHAVVGVVVVSAVLYRLTKGTGSRKKKGAPV